MPPEAPKSSQKMSVQDGPLFNTKSGCKFGRRRVTPVSPMARRGAVSRTPPAWAPPKVALVRFQDLGTGDSIRRNARAAAVRSKRTLKRARPTGRRFPRSIQWHRRGIGIWQPVPRLSCLSQRYPRATRAQNDIPPQIGIVWPIGSRTDQDNQTFGSLFKFPKLPTFS